MSVFTLNGEPLNVTSFTGFDLPDDIQPVTLLSDGPSTHNTVLQSSGSQMPTATVVGRTHDEEQIQLLRSYRNSHAEVEFVEPLDGAHDVVVLTMTVTRSSPATFLFEWTITVAEVRATGGSGS